MLGWWPKVAGSMALLVTLAVDVNAQTDRAVSELCAQSSDPDVIVGACGVLIDSGQLSSRDLATALTRRGGGFYQTRQYALALKDFERAASLVPNNATYHRLVGDARGNLARNSASRLAGIEPLEKAIGDFNRAIQLNPTDPLNFVHRGDAYVTLGRPERGLDDLNHAVTLDPTLADARNSRGFALRVLRQETRAIEDFTVAMRLQPGATYPLINRGLCFEALGKFDQALADFDSAVQADPASADAWIARGVAYAKQGKTDLAIEDFDQALTLKPTSADAYFNRGQAFALKGDKDRAMADYVQARMLDPQFPEPPEDIFEGYEVDLVPGGYRPRRPFRN